MQTIKNRFRVPPLPVLLLLCVLFVFNTLHAQQTKITGDAKVLVKSGTWFTETGSATVDGSSVFDIAGNVTVSGQLSSAANSNVLVRSSSGTDGSLIFNSGTPNVTFERYVGGVEDWHMVSVPLTTGSTTNNFFFNQAPSTWLMSYTESTGAWDYIIELTATQPYGGGYLFMPFDQAVTLNFAGPVSGSEFSLNSSSTPALTLTPAALAPGFHLVGNPFTSSIKFFDGSAWTMTDMEESIWILDQTGGQANYRGRTAAGGGTLANSTIPKGQAFFVRVTDANPTLTIPIAAKLHNSQAFYKNGQQGMGSGYEQYMTLRVNPDQNWDEIMVSFGSNGSNEFDNGYDCSKFMGNENSPQLFLAESSVAQPLSINHLQLLDTDQSRTVELNFVPGQDGEQTFAAQLDKLDYKVTLEDKKLNKLHDLSANRNYNFTGSKADDPARFKLHFMYNPLGNDEINASNQILVYNVQKEVVISPKGINADEKLQVQVFELSGRLLYGSNLPSDMQSRISLSHLPDAFVLVRVMSSNRVETTRLMLRD